MLIEFQTFGLGGLAIRFVTLLIFRPSVEVSTFPSELPVDRWGFSARPEASR
jgi:hypothetical protein